MTNIMKVPKKSNVLILRHFLFQNLVIFVVDGATYFLTIGIGIIATPLFWALANLFYHFCYLISHFLSIISSQSVKSHNKAAISF